MSEVLWKGREKTVLGRGKGRDNGQGREGGGSQLGTGTSKDQRQWLGRPIGSLGSSSAGQHSWAPSLLLLS